MSLCPEAAKRAAMSDAEFWEHVFAPPWYHHDPHDPAHEAIPTGQDVPCPVCGENGACGWDAEGRPLIHTVPVDDEPTPPGLLDADQ